MPTRFAATAGGVDVAATLSACGLTGSDSIAVSSAPVPADSVPAEYPGVTVLDNLLFGSVDPIVRADVCPPETDAAIGTRDPLAVAPRPAVLAVHGGS